MERDDTFHTEECDGLSDGRQVLASECPTRQQVYSLALLRRGVCKMKRRRNIVLFRAAVQKWLGEGGRHMGCGIWSIDEMRRDCWPCHLTCGEEDMCFYPLESRSSFVWSGGGRRVLCSHQQTEKVRASCRPSLRVRR